MAPLRVGTFNVLFDERNEGPGSWHERLPLIRQAIAALDADVVGLQEVLPSKLVDVTPALAGFEVIAGPPRGAARSLSPSIPLDYVLTTFRTGRLPSLADVARSRYEISRTGELQPIAYRRDRFRELRSGAFWISRTPGQPGSMLRVAHTPFLVHWAWLEDRLDGRRLLVMNGHLGHAPWHHGITARTIEQQLATLLQDGPGASPPEPAVLLLGDFNAVPSSALVRRLTSTSGPGFVDALRSAPERCGPPATFHWGNGATRFGLSLDYVLYRGPLRALSAEVIDVHDGKLHPSDHHGVAVDFEVDGGAASTGVTPRPGDSR